MCSSESGCTRDDIYAELKLDSKLNVVPNLRLAMTWVMRWFKRSDPQSQNLKLYGHTVNVDEGEYEVPDVAGTFSCGNDRSRFKLVLGQEVEVVVPCAAMSSAFTDIIFTDGNSPLTICDGAFAYSNDLCQVTLPRNLGRLGGAAAHTRFHLLAKHSYRGLQAHGVFEACPNLRRVNVASSTQHIFKTDQFLHSKLARVDLAGFECRTVGGDIYTLKSSICLLNKSSDLAIASSFQQQYGFEDFIIIANADGGQEELSTAKYLRGQHRGPFIILFGWNHLN